MTNRILQLALAASAGLIALSAQPALAQPAQPSPVIPAYGKIAPIAGFAVQPDRRLHYKVLFAVTGKSASPTEPNPSLVRVARFVNLLGAGGVRPKPGELVAIVFGEATPSIVDDKVYAATTKAARNPNAELIRALQGAGVTVAVCAQALAGRKFAPASVLPGVRVDGSALTTIATLQLEGWAYIPD